MSKSNMIKRADGSYSQRGLWDNIRANKGSGKAPTKQMLEQEAKIKARYAEGGNVPRKPIIVTDPNDPRLKAFNDSAFLYNKNEELLKGMADKKYKVIQQENSNLSSRLKTLEKAADGKIPLNDVTKNMNLKNEGNGMYSLDDYASGIINKTLPRQYFKSDIMPKGFTVFSENLLGLGFGDKRVAYDYSNVKPVQPVIYQKPVVKPKVENNTSSNRVVNITQEKFDKIKNKIGVSPFVLGKDGVYRNDLGEQYKIVKPVAKPKTVISNPNIQQPIQQNKNVVNTQPIQQPVAIAPQVPPVYTSQKQNYQGRAFMDSTKLRPGWYHPEQITERMKDPNRKFAEGGEVKMMKYDNGGNVTPKYRYVNGKFIPMHAFGDTKVGAGIKNGNMIAPALNIAQGFTDENTNPMLSEALNYGAQGASMGAMFGPWGAAIGGGVGLVGGAVKGYFDKEEQDAKKAQFEQTKRNQLAYASLMGKADNSNLGIKTNTQNLYAQGGLKTISRNHPNPQEEVEGGESAITPNGQNIQFKGPKHNNGGIKTNLPSGTRIFSDRLIYPGK